jgi:hypothetical protein
MFVVGAVAGKHDRITRQMAVAEGKENPIGEISKELSVRLKSPLPLLLNISMISAIFIVLGMMVFQPGQDESSA